MSTALLYQAFGLRECRHLKTRFEEGKVIFEVEHVDERLRCSCCGSYKVIRRGTVPRLFRTVPIGKKQAWLSVRVQRVFCYDCETVRQVRLAFADPRVRYTRALERYVLDLSRHMTIPDLLTYVA